MEMPLYKKQNIQKHFTTPLPDAYRFHLKKKKMLRGILFTHIYVLQGLINLTHQHAYIIPRLSKVQPLRMSTNLSLSLPGEGATQIHR